MAVSKNRVRHRALRGQQIFEENQCWDFDTAQGPQTDRDRDRQKQIDRNRHTGTDRLREKTHTETGGQRQTDRDRRTETYRPRNLGGPSTVAYPPKKVPSLGRKLPPFRLVYHPRDFFTDLYLHFFRTVFTNFGPIIDPPTWTKNI